jgi:hypothetical protein
MPRKKRPNKPPSRPLEYTSENRSYRFSHAIIEAISKNIREDQLPLIVSKLSENNALIDILLRKDINWLKNAKKILFASIKERQECYSTSWIKAVSFVADSSIYPDLKYYFIHGDNKSSTFESIKKLPGFEMSTTVDSAWQIAKISMNKYEITNMAKIAIQFGKKDAVDFLIRALLSPKEEAWGVESKIRDLIEIPWDETNIPKWYEAHRDQLSFDKKDNRWKLLIKTNG